MRRGSSSAISLTVSPLISRTPRKAYSSSVGGAPRFTSPILAGIPSGVLLLYRHFRRADRLLPLGVAMALHDGSALRTRGHSVATRASSRQEKPGYMAHPRSGADADGVAHLWEGLPSSRRRRRDEPPGATGRARQPTGAGEAGGPEDGGPRPETRSGSGRLGARPGWHADGEAGAPKRDGDRK